MGDFIKAMLLGIGFVWLTTFAGAKASGKRLTGIGIERNVFPQSMSGAARRTAKMPVVRTAKTNSPSAFGSRAKTDCQR
ncbi:hypothetical protein ECZU51_56360 [Escherichia coli]|nr:hypothetical protein ECZU51_56360 [Escherichia coli]